MGLDEIFVGLDEGISSPPKFPFYFNVFEYLVAFAENIATKRVNAVI